LSIAGRAQAREPSPHGTHPLRHWIEGRGPESFVLCRRLFVGLLGVVYLAAFASLWVQVDGLIGSRGILPVATWLEQVRAAAGSSAYWQAPTLLWLDSSNATLHLVCLSGMGFALLASLGVWPRATLLLAWVLYLSLTTAGSVFLGYQWDALLLETGLLSVFLAPPSRRGRALWQQKVPRISLWLLRWLLFRLMFSAGAVKLLSGDEAWWSLRALDYHFYTQPIPAWTSWYAHHSPQLLLTAGVLATLAIELAIPLLVFGPRRARHWACGALVALQGVIAATGNYGFFNLLSAALCLLLLDDAALRRILPRRLHLPEASPESGTSAERPPLAALGRGIFALIAAALFATGGLQLWTTLTGRSPGWLPARSALSAVAPFRSVNRYGLFAVMTTDRPEIELEGSHDGVHWQPYVFHWKAGPLERRPEFAGLHMPRLDWQMWFASLGRCRSTYWFHHFALRLLAGAPEVSALLARDPFADEPPRFVRSTRYSYRFTDPEQGGAGWWKRVRLGDYCPTFELADGRLTSSSGARP